ncbi:MAG: hypothetical protein ACRC20_05875 [Segniliparus sp.]|uniref:hypothetical protein n=1 Tax=Segniliparus sp. TaxID=2804064 RepID=UPI003F3E8D13
MGMVEELAALAAAHRQEFAQQREEAKNSFEKIADEHEAFEKANKELGEEQEREIYEKSAQAKHDQHAARSELKIGFAADEPETDKPHKRPDREDDTSILAVGAGPDEDEETAPYQRPQRWNDEEEDDRDEPSREEWGGSTRRIGHYDEDD